MINLKIGAIIIGAFVAGAFVMSPVPQAIAAVIATDVQCTGCVGTADVGGNAITAAKIKDGEVKAAEIATDAVGAAELQGVTKLLFGECKLTSSEASSVIGPLVGTAINCSISGVDSDDSAIAMFKSKASSCFDTESTSTSSGSVTVYLKNNCNSSEIMGSTTIGVIVFDK